jgi:hypothetical protein
MDSIEEATTFDRDSISEVTVNFSDLTNVVLRGQRHCQLAQRG